jgi:hypothetical protein
MPLRDHTGLRHQGVRSWQQLLFRLAERLSGRLNLGPLPKEYCADMRCRSVLRATQQLGSRAVDVGGLPPLYLPAVVAPEYEALIRADDGSWEPVTAVVLVGPWHKDRPEMRRALAARCALYLQRCVNVLVLDIVPSPPADLFGDLASLMGWPTEGVWPAGDHLSVSVYRPLRPGDREEIEARRVPLFIGEPLPVVSMPLLYNDFVPLDLEAAYEEACRGGRLT